jgi:hypothetical protein
MNKRIIAFSIFGILFVSTTGITALAGENIDWWPLKNYDE